MERLLSRTDEKWGARNLRPIMKFDLSSSYLTRIRKL